MSHDQRLDAYHFYEEEWDDYDHLHDAFEWEVPSAFNMAEYVCDRIGRTSGAASPSSPRTGTGGSEPTRFGNSET
nr:hypothetical protein [Haladaptatus sp. R4]